MKKNHLLHAAEIKVRYAAKCKISDLPIISRSEEAVEVFRRVWSDGMEYREECCMLMLNKANKIIGWFQVSIGGQSGTVVDPKIIFSTALKCHAAGIMIAHNHPSGNTQPSAADLLLTKNIQEAGKLLVLPLIDHIILTKNTFYSFADEGLL